MKVLKRINKERKRKLDREKQMAEDIQRQKELEEQFKQEK